MALLTFLIPVSTARAAFHHSRRLLGNLAGKLTLQFFSRLREALPFSFFTRQSRRAPLAAVNS